MGTGRLAVAAAVALAATALGAATGPIAHAGNTSSDELAKRYGVLQPRDLPAGYELDAVRRETGAIAGYFEVRATARGPTPP